MRNGIKIFRHLWDCTRGKRFTIFINDRTWISYCLRPKAKDLGITRVVAVVLVGFFVSKTHTTSLALFAFLFFQYFLFLFIIFYHYINLSFYYTCLLTYLCLSTNLSISTHLSYDYLPTPTNLHQHTYLYISAHLTYLCILTNTYQPISTYHNLHTYLYQYRIAADPRASIGLVLLVMGEI